MSLTYARHGEATDSVGRALKRGPATVLGLMEAFHDCYQLSPTHWRDSIPVPAGDLAHVKVRTYQELDLDILFELAIARNGVYVITASGPVDGAEYSIEASFIPGDARSPSDTLELMYFALNEQPLGRDLLAYRYRQDIRITTCQAVLDDLFTDNVALARESIRDHMAGLFIAPSQDWFRSVPPEFAAIVAKRTYPERRIFADGLMVYEDHVAVVPACGVVRAFGNGWENCFEYLAEDGSYYEGVPGWVDEDTWFRPTDEASDPGLAARFTCASEAARRRRIEGPDDDRHIDF